MNPESREDAAVVVPIGDSLDLHTFQPGEVASVVEEYLLECRRRNIPEVRIIHGKGTGVLRSLVWKVLSRLDMVADYYEAPPERGHWGATIVRLHHP